MTKPIAYFGIDIQKDKIMRDPSRISETLKNLERIWKDNPDFRLGQLIIIATKPNESCPELFYKEDDVMLAELLNFENRTKRNPQ